MRIYDLPSEKGMSGAAAVDSCTKFLNRMFRSPRVKASSSMSIMSKQLRRNECDWYSVITILIAMVGQAVNVRLLVEDGDRNLHFKKADLFQRKTQLCRLIAIDDIHWFIIKNKHIYVVRAKDKNFFEETSTYPKLDRGIKYFSIDELLKTKEIHSINAFYNPDDLINLNDRILDDKDSIF